MIVTNNQEWVEKARMLRDHGMSKKKKYWHPILGYNFRMTNIQAAIGLGQMNKIEKIIDQKRRVAQIYSRGLTGVKGIVLPPEEAWAKNVFWLYSILLSIETNKKRDDLIEYLNQLQVESRPLFFPIPNMPFYAVEDHFPTAQKISEQGISLPSGSALTPEQINYIIELIKQFFTG